MLVRKEGWEHLEHHTTSLYQGLHEHQCVCTFLHIFFLTSVILCENIYVYLAKAERRGEQSFFSLG